MRSVSVCSQGGSLASPPVGGELFDVDTDELIFEEPPNGCG
jgi:hypothetical protein